MCVQDEAGNLHGIRQHEGGEQGDPLMPLFSFAIQKLFAFLDDVCIVSNLDAPFIPFGGGAVVVCGRHWNQNGRCLRSPQGVKVLGTSIGLFEFIKEVRERDLPILQCGGP